MFNKDATPQAINNLNELNDELKDLKPSISGIALSMFEVKGANSAMLDHVIANNSTTLYDGIKRGDILQALKTDLTARVNNHPITFTYDVHGDKHFPGGPAGTKFGGVKAVVNPALEALINPHIGRIRRDANGKAQTYYQTEPPQPYTNGQAVAIQVDYTAGSPDGITYHGYPRDVVAYRLSRTLGGTAIA